MKIQHYLLLEKKWLSFQRILIQRFLLQLVEFDKNISIGHDSRFCCNISIQKTQNQTESEPVRKPKWNTNVVLDQTSKIWQRQLNSIDKQELVPQGDCAPTERL